jgi:uncharacterized protein (DUF2252 family)
MNIHKSTATYEAWLGEQIPLLRADLALKHQAMHDAVFPFMRATFYRWAQSYPRVCENLMDAPEVLGVGDLHVENFGTWRDIEGRLIWGINDFDEACRLPYTVDLVRLSTSALLAGEGAHLSIQHGPACKAILVGYRAALKSGGRPFALAEDHPKLREMAVHRLKDPQPYWDKLKALKTHRDKVPSTALKALHRQLPDEDLELRIAHRIAGLGSLGRRRYVGLAEWHGGTICREAKELAASAWRFARAGRVKRQIQYQAILDASIRCPDPFVRQRGDWIVRRLAPDCSRIELSALPVEHDAERLLHAMGFETANVHLGSCDAQALSDDLQRRGPMWLHYAGRAMADSTIEDWNEWRKG